MPPRPLALLRVLLLAALLAAPTVRAAESLHDLPYRWVDDKGQSVQLQHWHGRPAILTMEFSNCTFVCSITLKRLQDLQAAMDRRGKQLDIIVVSIDPKNDTPASWTAYRRARGLDRPNWIFLTGKEADTARLARLVGIAYWYYDEHLMHDFKLVRIDPDGRIRKMLDTFDGKLETLLE